MGVMFQVIAQFNATALLTQREQVSRTVKLLLEERARDFHIILEDVSITDLKFSREFERAVESKQVAQQVGFSWGWREARALHCFGGWRRQEVG